MSLSLSQVETQLSTMSTCRVAIIGDICLDVYWHIDAFSLRFSLETGLPTYPVEKERYYLGGAGTIINNLLALGCQQLDIYSVVGNDPWGKVASQLLDQSQIAQNHVIVQPDYATLAYVKPYLMAEELRRFDFGSNNQINQKTADSLLETLQTHIEHYDIVIVNEQEQYGIHSGYLQKKLGDLMKSLPEQKFIVDCRYRSNAYPHAILKINEQEACALAKIKVNNPKNIEEPETRQALEQLYKTRKKRIFLTRGKAGSMLCEEGEIHAIPAFDVPEPIDIVGAGDAYLACLSLALAANVPSTEAATLANAAAAVTVQKLQETGTASAPEILKIFQEMPLMD